MCFHSSILSNPFRLIYGFWTFAMSSVFPRGCKKHGQTLRDAHFRKAHLDRLYSILRIPPISWREYEKLKRKKVHPFSPAALARHCTDRWEIPYSSPPFRWDLHGEETAGEETMAFVGNSPKKWSQASWRWTTTWVKTDGGCLLGSISESLKQVWKQIVNGGHYFRVPGLINHAAMTVLV